MPITLTSVSLEDAQRVMAAGQDKAADIESPSNIAVVDAAGNLVSHIRMDNAWLGSVDISINKAFTARAFDIATKEAHPNRGCRSWGLKPPVSSRLRAM
ncbi:MULTISPECIES: GlcG/HbpS family heme-binding protein [Nocardioides]|uniref:GlcG/HbpS family heme-binding protein n=1 Tax=Nocardioides TaxID=1839 RepID=UPI0009FC70EF|nr:MULTISPECIES: heme-binding protein [Nocardioides]